MKCTGKEWDTCRVEKMGCYGCHYCDVKIGEYVRTDRGFIRFIETEKELNIMKFADACYFGNIVKHSVNIIDLIEVGDFVNGYKIDIKESTLLITKAEGIDRSGYTLPISQYGENIKSIVTKEQFENVEFKIKNEEKN